MSICGFYTTNVVRCCMAILSHLMHRASLMEIIVDRHAKTSLITNSPVADKQMACGNRVKTIANATFLDRIFHDAHHIEFNGEFMFRKELLHQKNVQ